MRTSRPVSGAQLSSFLGRRERSAGVILTFPSHWREPFRPSGYPFVSAFLILDGRAEEIMMVDADVGFSSFDSLPPGSRDPDPGDLDRLLASLDHIALCCCEPGADEASGHLSRP